MVDNENKDAINDYSFTLEVSEALVAQLKQLNFQPVSVIIVRQGDNISDKLTRHLVKNPNFYNRLKSTSKTWNNKKQLS